MDEFVYLILGCLSSGRRYVIHDLIKDLACEGDPFTLIIPEGESPNEWDEKLSAIDHVTIEQYQGGIDSITPDQINPHHTNVILSPGLANPVDQVEALKPLVENSGCQLGRIITIANCEQLEIHKKLFGWYDACVHFSDVCLINRGPKTTNQFVQNFIDRYKDNHIPCLFEQVPKHGVKNPGLVLEPQARRISLYFEPEEEQWLDEEDDDWEEPKEDPYIARLPSGTREKWIVDINSILES
jgi:hypothetical protein